MSDTIVRLDLDSTVNEEISPESATMIANATTGGKGFSFGCSIGANGGGSKPPLGQARSNSSLSLSTEKTDISRSHTVGDGHDDVIKAEEGIEVRITEVQFSNSSDNSSTNKVPRFHRRSITPPVILSTIASTVRSVTMCSSPKTGVRDKQSASTKASSCELSGSPIVQPISIGITDTTKYQRRGRFLVWPVHGSSKFVATLTQPIPVTPTTNVEYID